MKAWMKSIARRVSLLVAAVVLFAGVLFAVAPNALAESHRVEMNTMLKFSPETVTAKAGDTIVWSNPAGLPHNVVFEDASKFDAGQVKQLGQLLGKGEAEFTLPSDLPAGTYNYYCTPHRGAGMAGKIVVQ
jgi:plastocyanin